MNLLHCVDKIPPSRLAFSLRVLGIQKKLPTASGSCDHSCDHSFSCRNRLEKEAEARIAHSRQVCFTVDNWLSLTRLAQIIIFRIIVLCLLRLF